MTSAPFEYYICEDCAEWFITPEWVTSDSLPQCPHCLSECITQHFADSREDYRKARDAAEVML
jgi:hypothetical protein